jgi:3D (Asp-Asp-Asp) domain-containing protein
MKNYLKGLLLLSLSFICINIANYKVTEFIIGKANTAAVINDTIKGNTYEVTATMYYAVAGQCDSDPLTTAGMYKINPNKASEQKWIAMSRDMIARWGGEFNYGDLVEIKGTEHKDGIYKVVDTMNKRFTNRIDFLETAGTKPYKFNNVTLTKIEWKTSTSTESLLASL